MIAIAIRRPYIVALSSRRIMAPLTNYIDIDIHVGRSIASGGADGARAALPKYLAPSVLLLPSAKNGTIPKLSDPITGKILTMDLHVCRVLQALRSCQQLCNLSLNGKHMNLIMKGTFGLETR
jgi:hypothetical protein